MKKIKSFLRESWPWIAIAFLLYQYAANQNDGLRGLVVLAILILLAWLLCRFLYRRFARWLNRRRIRRLAKTPTPNTQYASQIVLPTAPRQPTSAPAWQQPVTPLQRAPAKTASGFASFQMGLPAIDYAIPAPKNTHKVKAYWAPPGESIEVLSTVIPGGMIYVGLELMGDTGGAEPSLINPNLPVERRPVDLSKSLMDYFPSYATMSPQARRAYIQWLAGGRADPSADIGYVFVFYYGLERRALYDVTQSDAARREVPAIIAEVRRLLSIYGTNNSFHGYATGLLNFVQARSLPAGLYRSAAPVLESDGRELPGALRLAMGQAAVDGAPVPSDWALAWAWADPNIVRRTAVIRCADQFNKLFVVHYAAKYNAGMKLAVNRTKLKVAYHAASLALAGREYSLVVDSLPDIGAVTGPTKNLQEIVDECALVIDSYSRFVGRSPEKADSLEASLLLPQRLWPQPMIQCLVQLQKEVSTGPLTMTVAALVAHMQSTAMLTRSQLQGLAHVLETLNIGIEPDILGEDALPKANAPIVLFASLPQESGVRLRKDYQAASLTLDLAASVALADGDASAPELQRLTEHIEHWEHLEPASRRRLQAHMHLQLAAPTPLGTLKAKLDLLQADARRAIAGFLAYLAHAEGDVTVSEVKFLETVYRTLQLDPQLVYSDLHVRAGPTAYRDSGSPKADGNDHKPGIELDTIRIAQMQRESDDVARLLSGIFTDEETVESIASVTVDQPGGLATEPVSMDEAPSPYGVPEQPSSGCAGDGGFFGLDHEHAAFVRLLVTRSSWSRAELSDLAADLTLMLDGALEEVNESMWDTLGTPLTEGDDPVELNTECLEKLRV